MNSKLNKTQSLYNTMESEVVGKMPRRLSLGVRRLPNYPGKTMFAARGFYKVSILKELRKLR